MLYFLVIFILVSSIHIFRGQSTMCLLSVIQAWIFFFGRWKVRKFQYCPLHRAHTAPESVKRVKSIKQILVKNKMEGWTPMQCWQKILPKKFKPSWTPAKNGVLWWPELPPSAFVAFNLQKNDPTTIFVRYFLHVRSSVPSPQRWSE